MGCTNGYPSQYGFARKSTFPLRMAETSLVSVRSRQRYFFVAFCYQLTILMLGEFHCDIQLFPFLPLDVLGPSICFWSGEHFSQVNIFPCTALILLV